MTVSSCCEQGQQVGDRSVDERGRDHEAEATRGRSSFVTNSARVAGAGRALLHESRDRLGGAVVDDAGVPGLHQAAHHVGAHAAESDHSELHVFL